MEGFKPFKSIPVCPGFDVFGLWHAASLSPVPLSTACPPPNHPSPHHASTTHVKSHHLSHRAYRLATPKPICRSCPGCPEEWTETSSGRGIRRAARLRAGAMAASWEHRSLLSPRLWMHQRRPCPGATLGLVRPSVFTHGHHCAGDEPMGHDLGTVVVVPLRPLVLQSG